MQPSYHRHSPRSASAANNLQTNPTRTNNQRDDRSSYAYSDSDPYSDRGVEEGEGEMAIPDQRNHVKVNQVIQVCQARLPSHLLCTGADKARTSSQRQPSPL
jgi:autophagy-related protein 13